MLLIAQWYPQESGTNADLRGVWFVDSLQGWVCADSGIVLYTSNGGQIWERQNSTVSVNLEDIFFWDLQTGWIVGDRGTIINTTNSGLTWNSQISGNTNLLRSVYFLDANYGWAVGDSLTICKTTDGGENWITLSYGTSSFYDVYVADFNTIIITGDGTIYKSIDGGASWLSLVVGSTSSFFALSFINANTGTVIGSNGTILRTTDSGNNWISQVSGFTNDLLDVNFIDADNGTVSGTSGIILHTIDGGNSWINQSSGTTNDLYGVSFVDANIGTVVGRGGVILRTENGGIPVELINFTADVIDDRVKLQWSTATETNNMGFEVERAPSVSPPKGETLVWERIGFVDGNGTTTETKSYSFTDCKIVLGKYSYRLKQIDFDGTFEYSNEIEVEIIHSQDFELYQNYPNPFNPTTTIKYSIPGNDYVKLKVFSLLGEEVKTLVDDYQTRGNYVIVFDGSELSNGIYLYKLETSDFSAFKKLILIK